MWQGLDKYEAELVVCRTAAVAMWCRHDPFTATARYADGGPPCLPVQHSVSCAPATADAATHHQWLTLNAQPSTGYQHFGPLAERSPAAGPTVLGQPKLCAVAIDDDTSQTEISQQHETSISMYFG